MNELGTVPRSSDFSDSVRKSFGFAVVRACAMRVRFLTFSALQAAARPIFTPTYPMPFVKLDCGILNSSLWPDKDARDIFITALLMAEPREFLSPVPQMDVQALKETGWAAPVGWYGFVPAAACGIIDRAGINEKDGLAALRRLGSPDKYSRSDSYEGRRMIRIDGGYIILNYVLYRERDYTAAERQRRWQMRRREGKDLNNITRNNQDITRHITQAEAEAYNSTTANIKTIPPSNCTPKRILKLKEDLGKLFNRKENAQWSYAEECQLLEVARREECLEELLEITTLKTRNPKFFPHSMDRLLTNWNSVLDRSRVSTFKNSDAAPDWMVLKAIEQRMSEHPARPNSPIPRSRITPAQIEEYKTLKTKRAVLLKSISEE